MHLLFVHTGSNQEMLPARHFVRRAVFTEPYGLNQALAVYALPAPHRKRMRSTNMLERWHQELKGWTRVVRIFPDGASCLRLVTALAMEKSEDWQGQRYLWMDLQEVDASLRQTSAAEPPSGTAA